VSAIELSGWLAGGYALVLLLVAYGIDLLARRAHTFNEEHQTSGFTYHEDHDAWLCPEDQWLWPQSFDPDNRVMRYRGSPSICNACPVKDTCTTSSSGREMQRSVDVWPASEAARFHRGIACVVVVLGLAWPVATAVTGPGRTGLLVLAVASGLALLTSLPLWSHLRHNPVHIPEGMATRTLDATVLERDLAAEALHRRRSTYRSEGRAGKAVS
jgi:hypothetical protein